ncbi:MAG: hypothetical protein FJ170_05645, partial [Gammaproteobacteria bacterium]|nr:hypothetical protein [Gammaproteobacteria bacterium]
MTFSVPDFSRVTVLVVGDVMLDDYWFGPTSRISPEALLPVVRVTRSQSRAGGAANVAINLASLGVRTTLTGIVGRDANGSTLARLLRENGVTADLIQSASQPTITKLRVLSRNQQLIRLDTEDTYPPGDVGGLPGLLERHLPKTSVCIFSDYAKGTLAEIQRLITICRQRGVAVLVDPKGSDFSRYRGASLLTPNLAEFEQ